MAGVRGLRGQTVGVTGATGFLGSHLALALRDAGAAVVGVVRRPERGRWLEDAGVTLRAADLRDQASLEAAFTGLDAVISNATLATEPRGDASVEAYADGDRQAAHNLVEAALGVGVTRFVHVSSVAVYRTAWPCTRIRADHPRRRQGQGQDLARLVTRPGYAESKARAEQVVWDAMARGLRPTVLRPGPVYGSRDPKLTARYLRAMLAWIRFVPTVRIPHVHAGDVALAAVGSLSTEASIGQAYNVAGAPRSLYDVARAVRAIVGRGPWLVPIPVPLWVAYDDDAVQTELGVTFRPLDDGLREALATPA